MPDRTVPVEVVLVYAEPGRARLFSLRVQAGTSIAGVIQACEGLPSMAGLRDGVLDVGIFGRRCPPEQTVQPGDRIEIYRPLQIDPKMARQRRARQQGA